jgi:hypothetical protein
LCSPLFPSLPSLLEHFPSPPPPGPPPSCTNGEEGQNRQILTQPPYVRRSHRGRSFGGTADLSRTRGTGGDGGGCVGVGRVPCCLAPPQPTSSGAAVCTSASSDPLHHATTTDVRVPGFADPLCQCAGCGFTYPGGFPPTTAKRSPRYPRPLLR